MIRVLVAEDSTTTREFLAEILRADPEVRVIGLAKDGVEAVEMTRQLRPDVVTMDIRMPRMDGFEATRRIMVETPTPIVIMSASLDVREVAVSMQAVQAGALVALEKPVGPLAAESDEAGRRFVQAVKAMSQVKVVRRWPERGPAPVRVTMPADRRGPRARIVAVAASTGGPAALFRLLSELPADFPVPIVAVQHVARGFVEGLTVWLATGCALRVKVAEHGERLLPRTVYLAPDDRHLGVSGQGAVHLSSAPPVGGFRPSGTVLFDSVARAFGASAVAIVLTGMGRDGLDGLRAVRKAGGRIIAQDEATSVVFGMPAAAIAAGLADMTLPIGAIAARLVEIV